MDAGMVLIVQPPSLPQNVDCLRDHAPRGLNEIKVRLIAALRLAHIHRLDHAVHIRQLYIAILLRAGMTGHVFELELGAVERRPAKGKIGRASCREKAEDWVTA